MAGFRRTRAGVEVKLRAGEAAVLRHLVSELLALLASDSPPAPADRAAAADSTPADRTAADAESAAAPTTADALGTDNPTASADPTSADALAARVGIPSTTPPTPTDPVLARLLPAGYRDDDEAAAEFRRYTEADLRAVKTSSGERVLADLPANGGRLVLDEDAAQVWLRTLNDLRLSLGTTLSVTEDTYDELARLRPSDPRARLLAVYGWLGYLQETLVTAVAGW